QLGWMGDRRAAAALRQAARADPAVEVRTAALEALGGMPGRETTLCVLAALRDPERKVREAAVRLCGGLDDLLAVDELIALLKEEPAERTWMWDGAVEALGELGDPRAVGILVAALGDHYSTVRLRAATALGQIGSTGGIEALLRALGDENATVRDRAGRALARI